MGTLKNIRVNTFTASRYRNLAILLSFVLLSACGGNAKHNTLGDLTYTPEQEEEIEFAKLNHEEVRKEYKELLDLFEDEQLKEQIERRIADVYMMESVHTQNKGARKKSYYLEAINEYKRILEKYPNSPDNAEVLYQLAKAYDMEGQQERALQMLSRLTLKHPYYTHIAEALFRKADIHFSNQQYRAAEQAYTQVANSANQKLRVNAHYMLAWSYYKQLKYAKSLDSFAFVLQQHLQEADTTDGLSAASKPMVDDTLHSISLALDKIAGAPHIQKVAGLSHKPYTWMIYSNLGDYYLEKELYGEAVESYKSFIVLYSKSKRAPAFHNLVIKAYTKGGFPSQALEEKALYVKAYGIHSAYTFADQKQKQEIYLSLRTYLDELAKNHHSSAQEYDQKVAKLLKKSATEKKIKALSKDALRAYDAAAAYYGELAETFPNDKKFDETLFFRAEVLFAGGRFDEAIADYEHVAYTPKGKSALEHRANSGYAAIISFQKYIEQLEVDSKESRQWQEKAVESMLKFSANYHGDERSPSVLTNATEYLFSLDRYRQAIDVATDLIEKNQKLDPTLKKTAFGIMAHSWFKLDDFVKAEESYLNQRALVSSKSEEYQQISERLATTLYKNSEVLLKGEKKEQTITQLLKIKALSPQSVRRVPAQYDAALLLMEIEKWDAAINELKDLQANFSEHELAADFPRKLAQAYEKDERWILAATAYLKLFNEDQDDEIKREALFAAAGMYEKAAEREQAIIYYKKYAHIYEQPFATRMEARYKLAFNYEALGDSGKQQYWLRRIIEAHRKAGASGTERSLWLAAWANIKYGDFHAQQFSNSKLLQPIVKSLSKRKNWLQEASARYQQAADSGLLEYVTMSGFKIASLYEQLATDLRLAPAPKGLSASDKTLYRSIIEEQAQPLEQLAIELHEANASRAWDGAFNEWIDKSFLQLAKLYPERYAKKELLASYGDEIR